MDDLVAFLQARLDEDDLTVREANTSPEMVTGIPRSYAEAPVALHIARFAGPERVQREVEAKRKIASQHVAEPDPFSPSRKSCHRCRDEARPEWGEFWPCSTLRLLASVYADHPDYRPEWRP